MSCEAVPLTRNQKDMIRLKSYEFRLEEKRVELEMKFKSQRHSTLETEWFIVGEPQELPSFVAIFEEACERHDLFVRRGSLTTKYEYTSDTSHGKIIMTQNFVVTFSKNK